MSSSLKAWLGVLIVVVLVLLGWYFFMNKHHAAVTADGSPTGNVDMTKYGLIEGASGYPSATPSDLQVCADNVATGAVSCTNVYNDNAALHGLAYTLAVLPGTYQVYSISKSHPAVGKGYYNSVTACIPTVSEDDAATICKKNEKILDVSVTAGQTKKNIDAWWYSDVYDAA